MDAVTLPGPSRIIVVEPVEAPDQAPAPSRERQPATAPAAPPAAPASPAPPPRQPERA
jgi:hypothetical protein